MVGKKVLKDYNFETIENYFEYIIESEINGQRQQVKDLVGNLSRRQKVEFLEYASENYNSCEDVDCCTKITRDLLMK